MCSVENLAFTLEAILENPSSDLFKAFANYLRQSYCIENLQFWLATQEYKDCKDDRLALSCENMINSYIRPNSPQEINIPCDMRQSILDFYQQGHFHPRIFQTAADAVLELMRVNSFVPWILLNSKNTHTGIKHSSSATLISDRFVKLKQISRKSWPSFESDDRITLPVTQYSNLSVYKSILKKIKKSLNSRQP